MKQIQHPVGFYPQSQVQNSQQQNNIKPKELVQNIFQQISQYSTHLVRLQNGFIHGQITNQFIQSESAFLFDTGEFYYGQFYNCRIHGYGIFILQNGSILKGYFSNGILHGIGQIEFVNRDIVRGFFDKGEFVGERVKFNYRTRQWTLKKYGDPQKQSQGDKYEHLLRKSIEDDQILSDNLKEYKVNRMDSSLQIGNKQLGCYIISRKDFFNIQIGSFNDNMRLDMKGKIFFQNGDIYDGNFQDQKFHGKGVYYNGRDNSWIIGIFHENQIKQVLQNSNSYPPPQYRIYLIKLLKGNVFVDEQYEKIDYSLSIDNNVICSNLLLKCLFGKNNQLYQNMFNVNSLKILVPTNKNCGTLCSSLNKGSIPTLYTTEGNSDETIQQLYHIQPQNSPEKQLQNPTEKRINIEQLISQSTQNSASQIKNIINKNKTSTSSISNSKASTTPHVQFSSPIKNTKFQTEFDTNDEDTETKQSMIINQENPELESQRSQRQNYQHKTRKNNNLSSQLNFIQQFFKLDQGQNKILNTQNTPIKKLKTEEQRSKVLAKNCSSKVIEQIQNQKINDYRITQSYQKTKPNNQISGVQISQLIQYKKNPKDQDKQIPINDYNMQKCKNNQRIQNQQQNNFKEAQVTPSNTYDDKRMLSSGKSQVLKTESHFSRENSSNQKSKKQSSLERYDNIIQHFKNHSETIEGMLKRSCNNPSSIYNQDQITQQNTKDNTQTNKTQLFTRTSSANNFQQSQQLGKELYLKMQTKNNQRDSHCNNKPQTKESQQIRQTFGLTRESFQKERMGSKCSGNKNESSEYRQNTGSQEHSLNRTCSYLMLRSATQNKQKTLFCSNNPSKQNSGCKEQTLSTKQHNKYQNDVKIQQQIKQISPWCIQNAIQSNYK